MLLGRNSRLLVQFGLRFVRRFSSKRPAVLNTRSLAEEDAGTPRIRHATLNSCGSKARLSFQNSIISTSFAIFMFTYSASSLRCCPMSILHQPMGIYSHGNKDHSHSHTGCFPFPPIPIPNFVISSHSHGIPVEFPFPLGIPFPWSSLL